jgi:hypothetical protein
MRVVLNNVADTTAATDRTQSVRSVVYVTGGTATVTHDGAVIATLSATTDRKVIDGLPAGTELTFTATSASTTAKILP